MLKVRIIPTLLWKDLGLVKGIAFDSWRRVGTVLPAVKVYNMREVDELIVLDITASREHREPDYEAVAEFSGDCFVPLTIGGGIREMDHIKKLLRSGADKIAINSAAYDDPELITRAAMHFGSQCVVASIDARKSDDGAHYCYSLCGSKPMGREVVAWAMELERLGAGEILITSVENDGTMNGYDLDLLRKVSENVGIPVIASGGAGNYQHMADAVSIGKSSAVAAASMFHFTEQTPLSAKQFLQENGIPVRNANMRQ
ncbi:MAG: imidazole glycerol phosphate synthase subunit HisF [Desulfobacteraceae bacterium]|nr:MAG: imidazole glycerol phosphate synthase subunit HisF [Desulfobacteraceae bacterium]